MNIGSEISFNKELLSEILGDQAKAESIVNELYEGFEITPEIPIVKNVIKVLRDANILDNTHVINGFNSIGWNI